MAARIIPPPIPAPASPLLPSAGTMEGLRLAKGRERLVWANIALVKNIFMFLTPDESFQLMRQDFISKVRFPLHLDDEDRGRIAFVLRALPSKKRSEFLRYANPAPMGPMDPTCSIPFFYAIGLSIIENALCILENIQNASEFIHWFGSWTPFQNAHPMEYNPFCHPDTLEHADRFFTILEPKCTSSEHYLSLARYFIDASNSYPKSEQIQKYMPSFALLIPCRQHDLKALKAAIVATKGKAVPKIVLHALKIAIEQGWKDAIELLIEYDATLFTQQLIAKHGSSLIDLCIEMGHPDIAPLLHYPISGTQARLLEQLRYDLAIGVLRVDIMPANPINRIHSRARGGEASLAIYQDQYRRGVAYIKNYSRRPNCEFAKLLENLCNFRSHMAISGDFLELRLARSLQTVGCHLQIDEWLYTVYAHPSDPFMRTHFPESKPDDTEWTCYLPFGEEIRARYAGRLPLQVTTEIPGYGQINLTRMESVRWCHPPGKDRQAVIEELGRLLDQVNGKIYTYDEAGARQLLKDIGPAYWLGSLFPIMKNGMPTTLSMILDSLLDEKCGMTVDKDKLSAMFKDLNCKALSWDNPKEFVEHVMQHVPLQISRPHQER